MNESTKSSSISVNEEIKAVISVMMHEYFSQTPRLRDTSAWVDAFAGALRCSSGSTRPVNSQFVT